MLPQEMQKHQLLPLVAMHLVAALQMPEPPARTAAHAPAPKAQSSCAQSVLCTFLI
jgi:hypothetical protein